MEQLHSEKDTIQPQIQPFAAPCITLDINAPFNWLKLGFSDIKRAPRQSLSYGSIIFGISLLVSATALKFGNVASLLILLSGFIFIGPVIAVGLYSISRQLQQGKKPVLGYCLHQGQRHIGNTLLFAVVLLVVFMLWARAASMIHVFFPMTSHADWQEYIIFLSIGSFVGGIFASIIFCASAFSLPMILDRKVDMVTAIVTSVNATLSNKKVMLLWALLILGILIIGFVTAFIGLIFLLPLLGHASWHAYQETIDAENWPAQI